MIIELCMSVLQSTGCPSEFLYENEVIEKAHCRVTLDLHETTVKLVSASPAW